MRRRALAAAAAVACALVACSALFDEASQCKTDRECEKFGSGLACDVAHAVCVTRVASADAGVDDDGGGPPPDDDAAVDAPIDDRCFAATKPQKDVGGSPYDAGADGGAATEITSSTTLDCTSDWVVPTRLFVHAGATLTIQPQTTLRLKKGAEIVVLPGGRIVADGRRDAPIVVTSGEATPAPGDHRGLVVLGAAPRTGTAPFDGDPAQPFGGANADDDSGVLRYVRVEYGTYGVVLAGAGRRTVVDFVEARALTDNCFMLQGGTVDVKHLVCQYPGDEILEFAAGYSGRVQFVFGQKTPLTTPNHHGLLSDNAGAVAYNLTLCGDDKPNPNYGLVFRNGTKLDVSNAIFTGWTAGVDAVGALGTPVELRSSIAFGNTANPAYVETAATTDPASPTFDDDKGFDEIAWFDDAARMNSVADPKLAACFDPASPKPWPATAIGGARAPPNDGFFDTAATYIGAFRDANDTWMSGAWVRFAAE